MYKQYHPLYPPTSPSLRVKRPLLLPHEHLTWPETPRESHSFADTPRGEGLGTGTTSNAPPASLVGWTDASTPTSHRRLRHAWGIHTGLLLRGECSTCWRGVGKLVDVDETSLLCCELTGIGRDVVLGGRMEVAAKTRLSERA